MWNVLRLHVLCARIGSVLSSISWVTAEENPCLLGITGWGILLGVTDNLGSMKIVSNTCDCQLGGYSLFVLCYSSLFTPLLARVCTFCIVLDLLESFCSWQTFRLLAVTQRWCSCQVCTLPRDRDNSERIIPQQLSHARTATENAAVLRQPSRAHYNLLALPNRKLEASFLHTKITFTSSALPLPLPFCAAEHQRWEFGKWCPDEALPRDFRSSVRLCDPRTVPLASANMMQQLHNQPFTGRGEEGEGHMFVLSVSQR